MRSPGEIFHRMTDNELAVLGEQDACKEMALERNATSTMRTLSSHASWEWPTPERFYRELDKEFHFNFDPCPLGGISDGRATLFCDWKDKRVFCNPPYGPEIPKFMARWYEAEIAVFLVPARTDTRWFHDICLR